MAIASPFENNPNKKLTKSQLANAIRADIASELEAIYGYTAHAEQCDDPKVAAILLSIAQEEKVHIGELTRVMIYLDDETEQSLADGMKEAEKTIK